MTGDDTEGITGDGVPGGSPKIADLWMLVTACSSKYGNNMVIICNNWSWPIPEFSILIYLDVWYSYPEFWNVLYIFQDLCPLLCDWLVGPCWTILWWVNQSTRNATLNPYNKQETHWLGRDGVFLELSLSDYHFQVISRSYTWPPKKPSAPVQRLELNDAGTPTNWWRGPDGEEIQALHSGRDLIQDLIPSGYGKSPFLMGKSTINCHFQ